MVVDVVFTVAAFTSRSNMCTRQHCSVIALKVPFLAGTAASLRCARRCRQNHGLENGLFLPRPPLPALAAEIQRCVTFHTHLPRLPHQVMCHSARAYLASLRRFATPSKIAGSRFDFTSRNSRFRAVCNRVRARVLRARRHRHSQHAVLSRACICMRLTTARVATPPKSQARGSTLRAALACPQVSALARTAISR